MMFRKIAAASMAVMALAAAPSIANAQATGKENNATTGSEPGVGPKSGPEDKGTPGMKPGMKDDSTKMKGDSSSSMKDQTPTSAGTKDEQSKDLRGHSEMPSTGGK